VDVGRDHDLTVIWLLEKLEEVVHTRAVLCLEKAPFDTQERILYEILERPNLRRCCIDQTGIGRQFAERAARRFRYRVEGVSFTAAVKEKLAYGVRMAFEEKTIRVPNEKYIRADLRSIRKETTLSGNIRFTGERNKGGHADRFWALALAVHAAQRAPPVQFGAALC
jgi:phage FluMu gp28-like protein